MKRKLEMLVLIAATSAALAVAEGAVAASSPSVTTGPRSSVTDTSAVLNGTINPNGSGTTYYFEWGLTTSYGVVSPERSAGRGTKPVAVHATAADLIPGTTYHYRLIAINGSGSATGADHTFTTAGNPPPVVATGPASQVGKNSATLTAVVGPNKQSTTWYFQYGTLAVYGSQTLPATVPAGTAPVTVAITIQGLEARTIFHYRIVALHSNTPPQPGADATFMTLPRLRPVPVVRARTKPHHAAHRPFVFTTSGSVRGPGWIPGQYDCVGNVRIRFLLRARRIASTLVPLLPNCKFSGQTVFTHLPGHGRPPVSLTVLIRFAGNGYLTPRRALAETVTLK